MVLLTMFVGMFSACNSDDLNSSKESYTEEQVLKSVNFVGENGEFKQMKADAIIKLLLGRPSRNCRGFGVCELCLGCKTTTEGRVITLPYLDNNGEIILELNLSSSSNIDLSDVNLEIEENVTITLNNGKTKIISKGSYSYNENQGIYGGYKLLAK